MTKTFRLFIILKTILSQSDQTGEEEQFMCDDIDFGGVHFSVELIAE